MSQDKFDKLKDILINGLNTQSLEEVYKLINSYSDIIYTPEIFEFPDFVFIEKAFSLTSLHEVFTRLGKMNSSSREKDWASRLLKNLDKFSPISLVVTFEQIKRGIKLNSIEEAYNMEAQMISGYFCINFRFMDDSDFFEGIRAMLIDKENKPNWKNSTYKEIVYDDVIEKYFGKGSSSN
jgi:3-hydroxyisobutyryl-CoA hydrolase